MRLAALVVAARVHDLVEHIIALINRPPQPVFLARDRDHDLIEVPDVESARRFAPEAAHVSRSELQSPPTDRLVRNDDPALEQHLLNQPKLSGNRKSNQTAWAMISGGKRWCL